MVKMHIPITASLAHLFPVSILAYIRKTQLDAVALIFELATRNKKHLVHCHAYFADISQHLSINDVFMEFQGQGHFLKFSWSGELLNRKCYKKVVNTKVLGLNMNYVPVFVSS